MYRVLLLCLLSFSLQVAAQAPAIVKTVSGAATEPYAKDQEGWKNNEWNGLFFYRGTGSPLKLCVTDGTNAGTVFVANLNGATWKATIPAQDFMYIITNTASFSPSFTSTDYIYRSDGTPGGTSLVYTMPASTSFSIVNVWTSDRDATKNYSVAGNTLYFGGYDATNGLEPWVTDGTAGGTHIVKDVKPGTGSSTPFAFCRIGADVFFTATGTGLERKLWKTDGTAAGTVQVPVAEPFFILDNAVGIVNNKMIFYAHNTVDGYEPYVSDGTGAGTFMLANINPSGNSWLSQSQNVHLRSALGYCFFIANNGTANALWRTDGTSAGTIQLTTNAQAAFSGVSGGSYSETDENGLWMIEYNAGGSGNSEKLYRSDGTVAGTYLVAQGLSYAQYLKSYKGGLWMASRNTGSPANTEPWRSGGNAATTNKAFEIEPANAGSPTFTPISSEPYGFFVKGGKLFFFATKSIPAGHNLYEYTGNFTFNGSQAGGRWRDSANWNGLMPPGITDTVYVNAGTPNVLQVDGANAYAGVLNTGNNAATNLLNLTDTLFVNRQLNTGSNNVFGFNGAIAFKNIAGDTVKINGGFEVNNIDVQSPASVLAGSITLYTKISFTGGKLLLNNNNFRFKINATGVATANNYFVTNGTGSLQVEAMGAGLNTTPRLFPVGTLTNYAPATVTNIGDVDIFSVRVADNVYQQYSGEAGSGSPYTSGAVNHTWFINEAVAGGSDATVTLQWNGVQELPGFDRAATYLGHFNTATNTWETGTVLAAAGSNPYTVTRSGINSFSPFGVLTPATTLPLRFLRFDAIPCSNEAVCLLWETVNEQLVSHFEIERSTDGLHFETINAVSAHNQSFNHYTLPDNINGLRQYTTIWYRIRQVDLDGKSSFSNIRLVRTVPGKTAVVYPNPSAGTLHIDNWQLVQQLEIVDLGGRRLQQYTVSGAAQPVHQLPAGQYILRLFMKDGTTQQVKWTRL